MRALLENMPRVMVLGYFGLRKGESNPYHHSYYIITVEKSTLKIVSMNKAENPYRELRDVPIITSVDNQLAVGATLSSDLLLTALIITNGDV